MFRFVFALGSVLKKKLGFKCFRKSSRKLAYFFSGAILLLLFQNCGKGFEIGSFTSEFNEAHNQFDVPQLPFSEIDNPLIIQPKTQAGYVITPANRIFFSGTEMVGVDIQSFKALPGGNFATDQKRVYFQNIPVRGAKPSSFRILSGFFSTDEKTVFYKNLAIGGTTVADFKVLNEYYAKDSYHVFYENASTGAEVATFQVIDKELAMDSEAYFTSGVRNRDRKPKEAVTSGRYFGTKNGTYYLHNNESFISNFLVQEADPTSIRSLSRYYGMDAKNAFYFGKLIPGADVNSFKVLSEDFAIDAKSAYYKQQPILAANPQTFRPIFKEYSHDGTKVFRGLVEIIGASASSFEIIGNGYSKDAASVFFGTKLLQGISPATIEFLGGYYVRDKSVIYSTSLLVKSPAPENFMVFPDSKTVATDGTAIYFYGVPQPSIAVDSFVALSDIYFKNALNIYKDYGSGLTPLVRDLASFEVLDEYTTKDKNGVYSWDNIRSPGNFPLDPTTFRILSPHFTMDKNGVYFDGLQKIPADPASFSVISESYSKDQLSVFYENQTIPSAIPASFQILRNGYSKDDTHVFFGTQNIAGARPSNARVLGCLPSGKYDSPSSGSPTTGPDKIPNLNYFSNCYLTDGEHVYNGTTVLPAADAASFNLINPFLGLAKDAQKVFRGANQIINVDPATFKYLRGAYSHDATNVFFNFAPVAGLDGGSFHYLRGNYAHDKDSLIYAGKRIPGPFDASTFQSADIAPGQNTGSSSYYMDSTSVYFNGIRLEKARSASFELVDFGLWAKDALTVYYNGKEVPGAAASEFRLVQDSNNRYVRDNQRVYTNGIILPGLDINTFALVGNSIIKDASKAFYLEKEIVGADAASFMPINSEYSRDANGFFLKEVRIATSPGAIYSFRGAVTSLVKQPDGSVTIKGWSCYEAYPTSVEFFADAPRGRGTRINAPTQFLPTPSEALAPCKFPSDLGGFESTITADDAIRYRGHKLYPQVSAGGVNYLLDGAGDHVVP